jgi:methylated-DNA-[protein]-cysteine S-methyltransferase
MKKYPVATAYSIYETATGFGALAANDAGLVAHHLPFGAVSAAAAQELVAELHPLAAGENSLTRDGAKLLSRYFAGERVSFAIPLELARFTTFQKQVYRVVADIPYGTALSYAEVASACGSPKAARAIGGAMAGNPLPILIPCHRVVGVSGLMTGFTAPGGIGSKRELLAMEGAVFSDRGTLLEAGSFRL